MEKEELTSREKRRRRRIRNQVLAYITLILFMIIMGITIFLGVKSVMERLETKKQEMSETPTEEKQSEEQQIPEQTAEPATQTGESVQEQTNESQNLSATAPEEGVPTPLDELVEALLQEMTLEEKVAGMFIVSPESITEVSKVIQAGEGTKKALEENPVGGILYTDRNFKSQEQFLEMLTNSQMFAKYPMFLAVSQECGEAKSFGIEETSKAAELSNADDVKAAYGAIAEKLVTYGINMNIAPVADVVSEEGNASLQGRTFGSDAASAAPLVKAAVEALQEQEISAVLTKFPGEGSIDTSQGFQITKSLEEMKNSEFLTYQMAIDNGADCVMVSHASAPEITGDDTPCSLSGVMIQDILRDTLGFQGVVMTDMLNDKKITEKYSEAEAAVAAITAGADILFVPKDYFKAYEGVMQAITDGTISEERIHESLVRIYHLKYKHALDEVE